MTSPTADTSVRVAWADDAPAIADVQLATWRESYDGVVPADVLANLTPEQVTAAWHGSLSRPADARQRVLVALERNRVVGFAITGPSPDPDADPVTDGEIGELTVLPAERGKGHGSRLLQAAADTLSADGFTRATLWVGATDDVLREFVTSSGWATDGAHRELALDESGTVTVKQVRLHTAL